VFNFSDDQDAVTEDELKTILLSSLQSANTILDSVGDADTVETQKSEKPLIETVAEIVQDAFATCDKSKNGKLSAKEFSTWLHKNPQIMDNVFGWQCPKPELGQWANETEQQSAKSLQDLFGGQSGESFFDSLGSTAENPGKNNGESGNLSPVPTSPTDKSNKSSVSEEADPGTQAETNSVPATTVPPSPVKIEPRLSEVENEEPFVETYDYYSAMWIPCKETSAFLEAIRNSTLKPENAEPPEVRMPCVQFDAPQVDPVKELISKFLNEQEAPSRVALTEDMVSNDTAGLKQLLRAECWRSALNLTTKLLGTNHAQNTASRLVQSPHNLEIWFCRIALFYQLKMYNAADIELEAFGNLDAAVLYYDFHPDLYSGKEGTMVPFCFRILAAMLPQYLDRSKEALDKLFYVHSVCLQVLRNLSTSLGEGDEALQKGMELWKERLLKVLYCIGNTFLSLREYGLAIEVFKQVAKRDSENSRALLSGIGRISLQSGDIESAQEYFKLAEEMGPSDDDAAQSEVFINRGLLALTLDAYEEAYKNFTAAKNLDPDNAITVNNAAVSLLFQGRLKEALELLEDVVFADPEKNLQHGILFNICTMYELETSRHVQKKQSLLELIAQHRGDGFNVSCLKFP
jgi:tetratricopeptide (TPR) repeat protein